MAAGVDIYPIINTFNAVTLGRNTVLTLVDNLTYIVDQFVSFRCPPAHGTIELDYKTARIIAISAGANTITVDIDSSDFAPFIAGAFTQEAEVIPAGEFDTLEAAYRNNLPRGGYTPIV